jgi:hypothetical protein
MNRLVHPIRAVIGSVVLAVGAEAQQVSIARHTSTNLSESAADCILADATSVLRRTDGPGDVSCAVDFRRMGTVAVFSTPRKVNSSRDYSSVCAAPGRVHVVAEITRCRNRPGRWYGCSDRPGACIVVSRKVKASVEGILWAHEFGHNLGLGHTSEPNRVMRSGKLAKTDNQLRHCECAAYLNPTGSSTCQDNRQDHSNVAMPVEEFVRGDFVHGVPYDEASRYGPDAVPRLFALLEDGNEGESWSNVAFVIGMIGVAESVAPLIRFVESGEGVLTEDAYSAKRAAVTALGYLYFKSRDGDALEFLTAGANSQTWDRLAWLGPSGTSNQLRNQELAIAAIQGLGAAGSSEAGRILARLRQDIPDDDLRAVVEDAIQLNGDVLVRGAAAFDEQ